MFLTVRQCVDYLIGSVSFVYLGVQAAPLSYGSISIEHGTIATYGGLTETCGTMMTIQIVVFNKMKAFTVHAINWRQVEMLHVRRRKPSIGHLIHSQHAT